MKRIGIISDTHNKLPEEALELLRDCDYIIHAGDICHPPILWELQMVAPVCAVLGNNDYADFGSSVNPTATITFEGVRFAITHEPRHLWGHVKALSLDTERVPTVAIHGHTHVPKLEPGSPDQLYDLLLCPGALNRSRESLGRRTLAKVEVEDGKIVSANILALDGEVVSSHTLG